MKDAIVSKLDGTELDQFRRLRRDRRRAHRLASLCQTMAGRYKQPAQDLDKLRANALARIDGLQQRIEKFEEDAEVKYGQATERRHA